jgi:hypothetical protein
VTKAAARRRAITPAKTEAALFLNIDLDIRSRESLAALAAAWPWAQRPRQLNGRTNTRWLILSPRGNPRTAEAAVRLLLAHIADLPRSARECWNRATTRTFDIGVQAGPIAFEGVQLDAATLRSISAIGGRVQVTVYPAQPEETERSRRGRPTKR